MYYAKQSISMNSLWEDFAFHILFIVLQYHDGVWFSALWRLKVSDLSRKHRFLRKLVRTPSEQSALGALASAMKFSLYAFSSSLIVNSSSNERKCRNANVSSFFDHKIQNDF